MPVWLSLLWLDIVAAVRETRIHDLAKPLGIVLWVTIILVPLSGIDRRDAISGITYTLYSAAAAIALILVLPERFGTPMDTNSQFMLILTIIILTITRWLVRKDLRTFIPGFGGKARTRKEDALGK